LYGQESCSHADAWVHAASSAAYQLPREWLPPLNDGRTHSAREEGQIFFAQPKAHQNKFADLNKMVPSNLLRMIAFCKQCQATDKAVGILDKIAKDKKQPKEKKTAHVPTVRSRESSYRQHCSRNYLDYHRSNQHNCNNHQSDYPHQDDWCHDCPRRDDKDSKSSKSYDKKDDHKRNYSKKKSNKAMHNDQSSKLSAGNLSRKRNWSCSRSFLRSQSWSRSCSSSQSYNNHHVDQDDRRSNLPFKHGYLYSSESDNGKHIHHPDKTDTVFATFSAPKAKKKRTQK
jgi:hypothetical protein